MDLFMADVLHTEPCQYCKAESKEIEISKKLKLVFAVDAKVLHNRNNVRWAFYTNSKSEKHTHCKYYFQRELVDSWPHRLRQID